MAAEDREVDARLAAGFDAVDRVPVDFAAVVFAADLVPPVPDLATDLRAAAVPVLRAGALRAAVPGLRAADERAGVLRAAVRPVAADVAPAAGVSAADSERCEAPRTSRSATRRASSSTSRRRPLRSSSTRDSSNSSRTLAAAAVTSWTSSCARPRPACAPSAVAWKVRSTALRTASTVSGAPFLSFFLLFFSLSFFAIAAQV